MNQTFRDYGPKFGDLRLPGRFWNKVLPDEVTGCWTWTAGCNEAGYGIINWRDRPSARAHRVAYKELVGPIPDDLVCDHLCRNRASVRPAHLDLVTHKVNILRGEGPSAKNALATSCPKGHLYDEANTWYRYRARDGRTRRECRQCNRDRAAINWLAGKTTFQKRRAARLAQVSK